MADNDNNEKRSRRNRIGPADDVSSSSDVRQPDFTQLRDRLVPDVNFTQLRDKSRQDSSDAGPSIPNPTGGNDDAASTPTEHPDTPGGAGAQPSGSTGRSLLFLALVFVAALATLALVYHSSPELDEEEKQFIKVPRDIEDAKNLGKLLHRYKDKYYLEVLLGYFVVFIFLQTFAIPGSIFLSIISGFLYPFYVALPIVCFCSALGATFCYLLSYMVGRPIVEKYIPQRAADWKKHVDNHRQHLFNYVLFLRITPFLPNWFINITSPVIDVPVSTFFLGTLFGVAPPSFVFIQAGTTLHQLTSASEAWSIYNVGLLALFALVALLPVAFKGRLRSKLE